MKYLYKLIFIYKAMILRQNGEIEQSLEILRMVEKLDPTNIVNIKQIGRSL